MNVLPIKYCSLSEKSLFFGLFSLPFIVSDYIIIYFFYFVNGFFYIF